MEEQQRYSTVNTVPGYVNYRHRPAVRSRHGSWISAWFLIWSEVAESVAFSGISGNLMVFLTDKLGESTAMAATNINAWKGVGFILPIAGAIVADTCMGRYLTIVVSSIIYIIGLGLITLSTALPTLMKGGNHELLQKIMFFAALYLFALGRGGQNPCIQAFGADQFDGNDPQESEAKSSFFNWWNFGVSIGALLGLVILSYVEDNLSWGLGFGIPCIIMVFGTGLFLLGTMTYRFPLKVETKNPFRRIGRVYAKAARNRNLDHPFSEQRPTRRQLRCLDKALIVREDDVDGGCSEEEVEEAKAVLRLFPIWAMSFVLAIVYAQSGTFFIKQGDTMDRMIGSKLQVPSASLQGLMNITMLITVPIYDYVFVPVVRRLTGKPNGITMLQRIGIGLSITILTMGVSAIVERKRLELASRHGLLDSPTATIPMSVWWLLPQYVLFGFTVLFALVGLQEFFYDQVPNELHSVGLAITSSIQGLGYFLCSLIVSFVTKATKIGGRKGWITDNLNRSHLDYYYWLLAGISAVDLALFVYFAKSYKYYKQRHSFE
ncbi:protein NRT1/ PTR FAMILY 5.10-like [Chenopodium quinoa]|uniref:Protein NRT1/ PTR FAMILY 5.10-like n=1 Tax=Chenopodium quinoa TaxID=63459 RepID=A0A803LXB6_CHEQI|nr:protein NRT1/ PTR FAMILY 5.10-like [Chenopodium quinoa]